MPTDKEIEEHWAPLLRCRCGCKAVMFDHRLPKMLQNLENEYGATLQISSGYRCPEHNKKVGGAPASYHLIGQAVDLLVPNKDPLVLAACARGVGFHGIGIGEGFIHIDLGPAREWRY